MNLYTVRSYAKALKYGSKFVYQTVPRLLTIWLDLGEDRATNTNEVFKRMNESAAKAIKETPVYKVTILSRNITHCVRRLTSIPSGSLPSLKLYHEWATPTRMFTNISRG